MKRGIIGLVDGNPRDEEIERVRRDPFAIEPEEITYLDGGASITTGRACDSVDTETEEIYIADEAIITERTEGREHVLTEFTADIDAGFVTIDRGDGEFLWERLELQFGVDIERAVLDLDSWARDLDAQGADVWQVGWDRDMGPDDGDQETGVAYHRDARLDGHLADGGITQLGFRYDWDGTIMRGAAAASGYVAVFRSLSDAAWGRWLREEILPHAGIPDPEDESEQQELPDGEPDDARECEQCGRESDSVGDDGYCIVCRDKLQEEGTLDDLDTVDVTGGPDD
ncbi:hypothetical protein [Halostella pelagica]|uniref:hypothetical protein n=1 Tax=Halostella pelagica TaxID=2583824 RepID=UPI00108226E8|nr:hypothetical protein [Halostella pelagica]